MAESWARGLAGELEGWIAPLLATEGNPRAVGDVLTSAGWHLGAAVGVSDDALVRAVADIASLGRDLAQALESPPDKVEDFLVEVGAKVAAIVAAILRMTSALPPTLPPSISDMPADLVNWLTIEWLRARHATSYQVLRLLGVITSEAVTEEFVNGALFRSKNVVPAFNPQNFLQMFNDPEAVFKSVHWPADRSTQDAAIKLACELVLFLDRIGLQNSDDLVGIDAPEPGAFSSDEPDNARISRTFAPAENLRSEIGIEIEEIEATDGGPGVLLTPFGDAVFELDAEFARIALNGTLQDNPIRIDSAGVRQVDSNKPPLRVELKITRGDENKPAFVVGSKDGLLISVGSISVLGGILFGASRPRGLMGLDLDAFSFSLKPSGDGFLAKVLPADGIGGRTSFGLQWTSDGGLAIRGGGGLHINLPTHIALGPIEINQIVIAAELTGASVQTEISATLSATLGPLEVVIERLGVLAALSFPSAGGNLGPANIDLGFKRPNGVGLSIDTGVVKGGGFLKVEPGRYSGMLQLSVKNTFDIKVIGILSTKLPAGRDGFALLLIVTVEFSPIQLGYGFTLNGVGGLAAFNRTVNVDALRDGIKNHTLDSIMFPPDPVANASKIISDLEAVFPIAQDRFVFAPMVKIGWGASILLIEVGLVVELPSPLRLVIMGKVHLLLPPTGNDSQKKPDKAVDIHLDVLGILDLDRNEISVDAVLYDSRLAIFPITGGMALRIKWGADPVFLLAIGGFNPRFAPPPGFPTLDRVGIQLAYDENGLRAGLLLTSYVAVTSSTVQFGARIDAYAEVSIAKIAGYLGFDALVEMAPFHIIVDVYGGVTVRAFGIGFSCDLMLTLTAFDPVTGDGHLTIDFFGKHEVPIHFAIGDAKPLPALPVADPLAELVTALSDIRNWSAALPMNAGMLVTFRQPTADELKASAGQVLAHPMGELSVRQKVLPFDIGIDRFGAAVPMSRGPFAISEATFGAQTSVLSDKTAKLRDSFARGQFVTLSEDDKLTSPQFESFVNGYAGLGTDQVRLVEPQTVAFDYDVLVIDSVGEQTPRPLPSVTLSYGAMLRATQFSASKAGSVDIGAPDRFTGASKGISVVAPKYKVISVDQVDPNDKTEFDTWTQADAKRRTGAKVSRRQVVESHEFA